MRVLRQVAGRNPCQFCWNKTESRHPRLKVRWQTPQHAASSVLWSVCKHGSISEDSSRFGCYAVSTGRQLPTFRWCFNLHRPRSYERSVISQMTWMLLNSAVRIQNFRIKKLHCAQPISAKFYTCGMKGQHSSGSYRRVWSQWHMFNLPDTRAEHTALYSLRLRFLKASRIPNTADEVGRATRENTKWDPTWSETAKWTGSSPSAENRVFG